MSEFPGNIHCCLKFHKGSFELGWNWCGSCADLRVEYSTGLFEQRASSLFPIRHLAQTKFRPRKNSEKSNTRVSRSKRNWANRPAAYARGCH